jgi:hypothetical protein
LRAPEADALAPTRLNDGLSGVIGSDPKLSEPTMETRGVRSLLPQGRQAIVMRHSATRDGNRHGDSTYPPSESREAAGMPTVGCTRSGTVTIQRDRGHGIAEHYETNEPGGLCLLLSRYGLPSRQKSSVSLATTIPISLVPV